MKIEKSGWTYEEYSGRHKLSHTMHGETSVWTFIQTGGVYTFDHWTEYPDGARGEFVKSLNISKREADRLIARWQNLEELI